MLFDRGVKVLAAAASRALGSVINKLKICKDLGYGTFSQLYAACVSPVLNYAAGVWGAVQSPALDAVENRAVRCFLGVHKFVPVLAALGDMGWVPGSVQRKCEMVRLWNRLVNLPENRVTKKVFLWSKSKSPWAVELQTVFADVQLQYVFCNYLPCSVNNIRSNLMSNFKHKWLIGIMAKPKLRTYFQIKDVYETELYVKANLTRNQRSLVAQLRTGILPLALETGRFTQTPEEDRLCRLCELGEVENETHFVLYCPRYDDFRNVLFGELFVKKPEMFWISDDDKMKWLFNFNVFKLATFVCKAWMRRQTCLFK